ncbi:MAG TPA: hypothetical protein VGK47_05915 [Nitrososphaeraceae archaeon]
MGLPQQEQKKILVVDDEPDLTMNSPASDDKGTLPIFPTFN